MKTTMTRKEYMENASKLATNDPARRKNFSDYYGQFITHSTEVFVLNQIGIKKLKTSKDEHFNDIIKHSNGGAGGWVWDHTPINLNLARELGEVGERCMGSMATHTCIGKEAARRLLAANP